MTSALAPPIAPGLAAAQGAANHNPARVYIASLDSEHSRRAMLGGLKRALRSLGVEGAGLADPTAFPWERLRRAEVVAIRSALVGQCGPACVNQSLAAVRGVAKEAWRLGLMTAEDHARIADVPGVRSSRLPAGRDVPEDELARIFAACDRSHPVGVRDAALIATLRTTGARRHEVCKVGLDDLDLRAGTFTVIGKRDKERTCHLGDARVEVDAWLEVRGPEPGPLFLPWSARGQEFILRPLTGSGVYWILKKYADRAGVKMSPHDLRRTATGDLLDEGVDLATVQKLLGHADPKTTSRYDRRDERAKSTAAAKLKIPR